MKENRAMNIVLQMRRKLLRARAGGDVILLSGEDGLGEALADAWGQEPLPRKYQPDVAAYLLASAGVNLQAAESGLQLCESATNRGNYHMAVDFARGALNKAGTYYHLSGLLCPEVMGFGRAAMGDSLRRLNRAWADDVEYSGQGRAARELLSKLDDSLKREDYETATEISDALVYLESRFEKN